ncbi:NACHT domain-containing protein [Phormidium sp. FACHB-592]|uniref:NACHT domain-containing protein n=1 Tax=Stenomitos frigidus AS-A4 TaxID=2933935 RepID=A0ABV0KRI7_9CYAN|nr:NACHT domain-containing protein [Phormidium sp. FACHB-592]MBD2074346.1 NACHT domain-containing protein [Phormidium sp. FACHB-592]
MVARKKAPPFSLKQLKRKLPFSLFALVLTALLLLHATPLPSQTPSPSATDGCQVPQPLCQEIRQLAQDDVEAEILRRTPYAIDQFKELHPDWKTAPSRVKLAIGKTYDTEYTQRSETNKKDPLKAFQKLFENGFALPLLALAAILGGLLNDTIKQWLTALSTKIGNWIYARFAGIPLFRGIALRRYRAAVAKKYHELHIPFRPNRPLQMAQVYVPLKVKGTHNTEQVDAYQAMAQAPRLMVTGQPGSGKSMLLKHLALSYAEGRLLIPGQPVAILLELHRLSDLSKKIEQHLVEALARDDFPKANRFVTQALQGPLMLLLDGLDEVNSSDRPQVVKGLRDFLDTYENCRVIITCRSQVYQGEFADKVTQTLEVVDFSDQQIRRFLECWKSFMPPEKSIEQLLRTLRDRPRIMELARNPLLLTIIAYLYTDTPFVLPHSRAEFYRASTEILLETWDHAKHGTPNVYKGMTKRLVLQQLALHSQNSAAQQQQDKRSIDVRTVWAQIKAILPELNRDPDKDTEPLLREIVERSGLFMPVDGGEKYQFAHLTLQEFFAAAQLLHHPDDLVQRFQADPATWLEPVKLWCGLSDDCTAVLRQILAAAPIIAFEALADAQKVDPALADSIIDQFKPRLSDAGADDAIARAFGAVAADLRPRGKAVFQFLQESLASSPEPVRQAAATALSLTNLPAAAQVLVNYYTISPAVMRPPLIRLGDLAVPLLAQLIQTASPATRAFNNFQQDVLNDLQAIGTPDAALALVQVLWHNDLKLAGWAAWNLATLLPESEIEDGLRQCRLSDHQRQAPCLNWIWQPFGEPATSALPVIAGRVAHLLVQAPLETMPEKLLRLDPRLVIPLCSIHLFEQVELPDHWTAEADSLSKQQKITPEIEQAMTTTVNLRLFNLLFRDEPSPSHSHWQRLLVQLPPQVKIDLLHRLVLYRRPQINDWRNLFRPIQYEFRTSCHYRSILLLAAALSLAAMFGVSFIAADQPAILCLGAPAIAVVVLFWLVLWKGIEAPLEPDTFLKLGILGPFTGGQELSQSFRKSLAWVGIERMYEILTEHSGAVAVAVAVALALAAASLGALVGIDAGVDAGAGPVAVAVAAALAAAAAAAGALAAATASLGAAAGLDAVAVVVAVAGPVAVVVAVAVAVAGLVAAVGPVAVAGLVAGAGLGAWYSLKFHPEQRWLRWVALLSFPWFCSFPIVVGFSSVALYRLLQWASPFTHLPLPLWLQTALIALVLAVVCTILWRRGQALQERARNPLQGGILEQAIRGTYTSPFLPSNR